MAGGTLAGAAEALKKKEEAVTAALAASTDRMWAATQMLLERCALRSALGDSQGALQDANSVLGMTPDRPEYLIQTAQALIDANHGAQACQAFQRAKATVGEIEDHNEALIASLATLDRRLRPHNGLPDELLASIFEWVYLDWQQLPSPFQVAHVCSRWRRIALSTPTLWRDTRILRVAVRLPCEDFLSIPIRKPYLMPDLSACPNGRWEHPRGSLHGKLLEFCADKSHDTITHYELELSSVNREWEAFQEVLASASHLQHVSIINHDKEIGIVQEAMGLVFMCPKLTTLELSLGKSRPYNDPDLRKVNTQWSSAPSLRTLKLHHFNYFDGFPELGARQIFLQRCSQVESLTILEMPERRSSPADSDVIQQLLQRCAHSLVNLATSARAHIFERMKQLGVSSLPKLRVFRHVPFKNERYSDVGGDLGLVDLPNLEKVEAPFAVVSVMTKVPPRICFTMNDTDDIDKIAKWLQTRDDADSLQELRLESSIDCGYSDLLRSVIDALTPSKAGKVLCPRLSSFAYIQRDEILRHGTEASPFDLRAVRRAKPVFDDEWDYKVDASCVARMEVERRRVAEGLPPIAPKRPSSRSPTPSSSTRGSTSKEEAAVDYEPSKIWAPCQPLQSVIIEDCRVQPDVWAAMKASPTCRFEVYPDPDEINRLPKWQHGRRHRLQPHYC